MRTGVPFNENRPFPVGIDLQGVPCKLYRVWVYSAYKMKIAIKLAETVFSILRLELNILSVAQWNDYKVGLA